MTDNKERAKQQQRDVLNSAIQAIKSGERDIVISGAAGTGKSYINQQLLEEICKFRRNQKILVTALSHQAVGVAAGFLLNSPMKNIATSTVASGLAAKKVILPGGKVTFKPSFDYEDGKKKPPKMAKADIIVVDECSQMNNNYLEMIDEVRKPNSIVIYLGDKCQLPPPERAENEIVSNVFKKKHVYELTTPYRYEGYIAEVGLELRNEILRGINGQKVNPNIWQKFMSNKNHNEINFINDKRLYFDKMIGQFKADDLLTKYIAYTRENYIRTGEYIRNILNPNKPPFDVGDNIVCKNNYYEGDIMKVQNGQEFKITGKRMLKTFIVWGEEYGHRKYITFEYERGVTALDVKTFYASTLNVDKSKIEVEQFDYWSHDFNHDTRFINTLPKDKKQYERVLADLSDPNKLHSHSPYRNIWEAKNAFEENFCDIKYSYAMTSHTSQGSTYKNVFVNLQNIMAVTKITDLEKLQSLYVSMTRATDSVTVFY